MSLEGNKVVLFASKLLKKNNNGFFGSHIVNMVKGAELYLYKLRIVQVISDMNISVAGHELVIKNF